MKFINKCLYFYDLIKVYLTSFQFNNEQNENELLIENLETN